jgi:hypothetical protein
MKGILNTVNRKNDDEKFKASLTSEIVFKFREDFSFKGKFIFSFQLFCWNI